MHHYSLTDRGFARKTNEDSIFANDEDCLYLVADGVGGMSGGEIASKLAIEVTSEHMLNSHEKNLTESIVSAHEAIKKQGKETSLNMMTTIVALHATKGELHIAHAGDSRAYRLCNEKLQVLTKDHSLLNSELQNGRIEEKDIKNYRHHSAITNALGMHEKFRVEQQEIERKEGDLFLLASDGLTNFCTDEMMKEILQQSTNLEECGKALYNVAMRNGGKDNISLILIRI